MHVAQTYPFIASYMIGIHMTIDGWQEGRDAEGWRIKQSTTLPFKSCSPNFRERNSLLEEFCRHLLSEGVSKETLMRQRNILRTLLL